MFHTTPNISLISLVSIHFFSYFLFDFVVFIQFSLWSLLMLVGWLVGCFKSSFIHSFISYLHFSLFSNKHSTHTFSFPLFKSLFKSLFLSLKIIPIYILFGFSSSHHISLFFSFILPIHFFVFVFFPSVFQLNLIIILILLSIPYPIYFGLKL